MNTSTTNMIALAGTLGDYFEDSHKQSEQELRELIDQITTVSGALQSRRVALELLLQDRRASSHPSASFADARYQDTLQGFGFTQEITNWFGAQGLGIRSVTLQLTKYPRSFLAEQLELLSKRKAMPLDKDQIDKMLNVVQQTLSARGLSLRGGK